MDRRKNGATYLPSQHVPSSTGRHWNQNTGPRHSYMRYTSTTAVSTPVPVSPPSKAGGESNPILGTSNSSVPAFVLSALGIVDPNWTNTISPDYSLGTHQQTKTYGTLISTAASRKHAITPLSTKPGTCRTIAPRQRNSYTHLDTWPRIGLYLHHKPARRPYRCGTLPTTPCLGHNPTYHCPGAYATSASPSFPGPGFSQRGGQINPPISTFGHMHGDLSRCHC
jgi:hypothetical protein